MSGLSITEEEFDCLPNKEQHGILFKNQLKTMGMIRGYRFYQKITATIGGFLVLGMGILFRLQFK